jgi:hypothetical protein
MKYTGAHENVLFTARCYLGEMSWVEPAEWSAAEVDPVAADAEAVAFATAHMNEDHQVHGPRAAVQPFNSFMRHSSCIFRCLVILHRKYTGVCGDDLAAAGGHHQAAALLMTRVLGGLPGAVDASILSFDRYGFDILAQTAMGREVILENLFKNCFRAILGPCRSSYPELSTYCLSPELSQLHADRSPLHG